LREITEDQLEDIALGAAILGTGGGGSPRVGKLLAREAIRTYGPVTLVDPRDVPDDALVAPAAVMGAPTVLVEKLPAGTEIVKAFEALQHYIGRPITHVLCAEVGGANSMFPFLVAARERLPLVDADLMGRAFPEVQMCLPTLTGRTATPMTMADEQGNSAVIDTVDNHTTERLARLITIERGCQMMIAVYPLEGRDLAEVTVQNSLTLSEELGRLVRETRTSHGDPIGVVTARLGGVRLFSGKMVDVARRTTGGFARAEARLEGLGDDAGSELVLHAQNEHLVAFRDGEVVATVPDLIMVLDSATAEPITTENLQYGLRVTVIAAPCDPRWRSDAGLEIVGPRYFGYDLDYVPIEARAAVAGAG
jgi:uncharacterized protein